MAEYAVTALVALAAGAAVGWFLERLVRGAAYQKRDDILAQANRDADTIRKSQELAGKEDLLARREELEKEMSRVRDELREQERRLDRRESTLDDQQQDIVKKERMLELTQRKLAERTEAVEARDTEVQQVLKQQQDQLYKISGMSPQAAQDTLLSRLNQELKNETGKDLFVGDGYLDRASLDDVHLKPYSHRDFNRRPRQLAITLCCMAVTDIQQRARDVNGQIQGVADARFR